MQVCFEPFLLQRQSEELYGHLRVTRKPSSTSYSHDFCW